MALSINNTCNEIINGVSLEILISGYLEAGTEWSKTRTLPPPYAKLYFILGGDAYITSAGVRTELKPGRAYLIPTDLIYDNGCVTGIHFLYFNIRLMNRRGRDLLSMYNRPLEHEYDPEKTLTLVKKYLSQSPTDSLSLKADLTAALLELLSTAPEVGLCPRNFSESVRRALDYIDRNLSIELRIDDICKKIYVARSTLIKRFGEEVGMSIGEYITSEVMTRCEQLLCETDMTIGEISERFGFCDQFYFSRRFKEKYGETPQKYRRNRPI